MKLKLASREQDTFEAAFAAQIAEYRKQQPDVEIEVVTRPIHDHYMQLVHEDGAEREGIDLLLCCTDWLPEAIERGLLQPLDEYIARNPPQDWSNGWHPAMLGLQNVGGKTYGLPWHDGPEVFHYRRDLFEDPNEQQAYQSRYGAALRPPKTWSEFVQVAQFFTRPDKGLWGCCEAAYTDGHNNVYDFLIQLWSRGGVLFDKDCKPRFQEQEGVQALEFYSDLFHVHKVASPDCLNFGSVECGDYYAQGNAAMTWNWCGFAAVCEMPQYSRILGKNACTTLPVGDGPHGRSVSLNIYWVLTLLARSSNKDEAYRFMQFLTQPQIDRITSLCGANGVRLSTWRDPEIRAKYPYYSMIEQVHAGTKTLPAIPEFPELNEFLSEAVHEVVHEQKPAKESLDKAAAKCTETLRRTGRLA